jgi:hypothetical protein
MLDPSTFYKAGIVPTIIILGGLFYVGILILVLLYTFLKYLKNFLL